MCCSLYIHLIPPTVSYLNPCHTWVIARRGLKLRHNLKLETRPERPEGWDTVRARDTKQIRYQTKMRRGIDETRDKAEMQVDETRDKAEVYADETDTVWLHFQHIVGEPYCNKAGADGFAPRSLPSSHGPFASLLTKLAHCVWLPSWIVGWGGKGNKRYLGSRACLTSLRFELKRVEVSACSRGRWMTGRFCL